MKRITSRQNVSVSRYRDVARGVLPNLVLLDGPHLVNEALTAGLPIEDAMVALDALENPDIETLVSRLTASKAEVSVASAPVMAAVSPVRSPSSIVALATRPTPNRPLFAGPSTLLVIASDVQDPGNIGAIVRVAEAAGASGMIAAGRCADPFGWKALRGSMGSALRLPVAVAGDPHEAIADARSHGCRVVATIPAGGRSLYEFDLRQPVAVLIGGEGHGLAADLTSAADDLVTVPMAPPVESLNAAVTAAVILYEAYRQREARGRHD